VSPLKSGSKLDSDSKVTRSQAQTRTWAVEEHKNFAEKSGDGGGKMGGRKDLVY